MSKVHVVSGRVECPESIHLASCLKRYFEADGCTFVDSRDEADVVVFNGCERIVETPAMVREHLEFSRGHPDKNVLVVGCVPADVEAPPDVKNFHLVPFWKLVKDPSLIGPDMGFTRPFALLRRDDVFQGRFPVEEDLPGSPEATEVCLLMLGSGCRGRCTYCTIRRGRGGWQSEPLDVILADARAAVGLGRFRFVLIADDAGCWGRDLGLGLPHLLASLVDICSKARFLVRTMNPVHLPGMFDGLEPFLERIDYLYLPLQSGSDRILKLMKRGYRAGEIAGLVRRMREGHPGITLKTDFIVGFPTETREDFRQSVHAAQMFDHASFHRFTAYPGTPAATMDGQVPPEEIRTRIEVVRRLRFSIVDPGSFEYGRDGVDT